MIFPLFTLWKAVGRRGEGGRIYGKTSAKAAAARVPALSGPGGAGRSVSALGQHRATDHTF